MPTGTPLRSPGPFSALLSVTGVDGHKSALAFRPPRMVLGRKRPADVTLDDPRVSSRHCELAAEEGGLVIRDLSSNNGTFVNELRVEAARLEDGDQVRLGNTVISVSILGSPGGLRVPGLRGPWPALVGAGLVLLLAFGLGAYRWQQARRLAELRERYVTLVRSQLEGELCAAAGPFLEKVQGLDGQLAGHPIPLAAPGRTLSAANRARAAELIGLYRAKVELLSLAALALSEAQQRARDDLERVSRLSARLPAPQDKRVAFWAEGQLSERVAQAEAFQGALQLLARETGKFTAMVDAAALRGETGRAAELTAFRFPSTAGELLRACSAGVARADSGVLGALNAFDEP